ncbi:hypothetical protein HMPREF1052_2067 [Pasteurella bettyae CCUG 2042]|uniref:Uncharacterized protein n=1 Tax=Pasteurella bettyae CCUG 2042 TaxID=1095749 RepID=I3DK99_9PAST|nr:hypothetical protein HMPREF1052_2067 [Pasteurella bettyae CCUG 2042]
MDFDGENTRTKGRDLFDLHVIAKNYTQQFTSTLAVRLMNFSADPDKLVSLYKEDIREGKLLTS